MGLYENLIQDLSDMGKSASTLYGYINKSAIDSYRQLQRDIQNKGTKQAVLDAFKNTISNPTVRNVAKGVVAGGTVGSMIPALGTVGGAVTGGIVGGMGGRNYINAALSPYNLSINKTYTPKEILSNIKEGAYYHPATAAIDFLSLGGSRLVGPPAKAIGQSIGIAPTNREKILFRDITEALNKSSSNTSSQYRPLELLSNKPLLNRVDMVKYITTNNKGNLSKQDLLLGDSIKNSLNTAEKVAVKNNWISAKEAKNNTIAQYVMAINSKDNQNLLHEDIIDYLSGNTKNEKITKAMKNDIAKATELYDKGKISFLTQAIVNSYDPTGSVVARNINKNSKNYFETRRIIGRTLAEDMNRKLDDSIKYQLDKVYRAQEAQQISTDILTQYGRPIREGDVVKSNEVVVSPKEIRDVIARSFIDNNSRSINDYLRNVGKSGLGIAIDKKYIKAVTNALQGNTKVPFSRVTSIIKRSLLAQPHWFALNRIGNASNNMIEGVTLGDYIDAIKYAKYAPNSLKSQTSFNSFISEYGKASPIYTSWLPGVTKIVNTISNFKPTDSKSFKNLALGLLEGSNELVTQPIFKSESTMELLDRYANFIRQAKRYSEGKGLNFVDVIKKSNTNTSLYNKLNNKVNKSLGDYVGKNYNISPNAYQYLSMVAPFYRFISQTGRTTWNQLNKRGLAYQSLVQQPQKIGSEKREELIQALGLNTKDFIGGVPYKISGTDIKGKPTKFRMIGGEPLPIQSVAGDISKILQGIPGEGIVSPIYTTASDLIQGTKYGRPIKTPYKEALIALGLPYNMVEKVELSPKERWKYIANTLAGYVSSPYRLSTTYMPELVSYLRQQPLKSRFDTDPYLEIPSSYPREGRTELLGRWIGITNRDQYLPYKYKVSGKDLIINRRKYLNKVK